MSLKLIQKSNFGVPGRFFSTIELRKIRMVPISGNHVHAFYTIWPHTYLHLCNHINYKKMQYNFPKRRGGAGVKGRFEFFRKLIRFGGLTLPLVKKDQKTFSMPKGCLLLVIEPVHRGSSSILLVPFLGHPVRTHVMILFE